MKHNHLSKVVKPVGECSACDAYHDSFPNTPDLLACCRHCMTRCPGEHTAICGLCYSDEPKTTVQHVHIMYPETGILAKLESWLKKS